MPKWTVDGVTYHSNAPDPKRNIYTAPMITVAPSIRKGYFALTARECQLQRFHKSLVEINSMLLGHGYIKTGEEGDKQFYSKATF